MTESEFLLLIMTSIHHFAVIRSYGCLRPLILEFPIAPEALYERSWTGSMESPMSSCKHDFIILTP